MKKLKKSLAFIVSISMLATLSACNSDNKDYSIRNRKRQKRQSCVSPDWLINRVCFPNE